MLEGRISLYSVVSNHSTLLNTLHSWKVVEKLREDSQRQCLKCLELPGLKSEKRNWRWELFVLINSFDISMEHEDKPKRHTKISGLASRRRQRVHQIGRKMFVSVYLKIYVSTSNLIKNPSMKVRFLLHSRICPQEPQGCQKIHKKISKINLLSFFVKFHPKFN